MKVSVTYAQLKTLGALGGALVRYSSNGDTFRAVTSVTGHPVLYFYDAQAMPGTWALDFPLALQVDAIDF